MYRKYVGAVLAGLAAVSVLTVTQASGAPAGSKSDHFKECKASKYTEDLSALTDCVKAKDFKAWEKKKQQPQQVDDDDYDAPGGY
ncbi:hypothetical protein ACIBCN_19850 [Nocardia sp. NPDC051052]|uniref:hypothetical protein n=1 Tax=Nocardia sp. NPDC051052 TaxID=3364322 RepID=UPI00379E2EED